MKKVEKSLPPAIHKRCPICRWWVGHEEDCPTARNCIHIFAGQYKIVKVLGLKRKIKVVQCINCGLTRIAIMKIGEEKLPKQI